MGVLDTSNFVVESGYVLMSRTYCELIVNNGAAEEKCVGLIISWKYGDGLVFVVFIFSFAVLSEL